MKPDYKQIRFWTIKQLEHLRVLCSDCDLDLNNDRQKKERDEIASRIDHIKNGKYRMVFLGAFNVGKSTLINAMLGAEYLPAVLEECTAKIVHLIHSKTIHVCIKMEQQAKGDLNSLKKLFGDSGESLIRDNCFEYIFHDNATPSDVYKSLEALVTVSAVENKSELCTVSTKITEVELYLPLPEWAEDIVLTDSPGVTSMSETRQQITYDIIPNSQLVVEVIDCEHAGNREDHTFIQRIKENWGRHIFFLMNKADQIEEDEIDETGKRGPANSLRKSLAGCVEKPEIIFVSGLYALRGRQLAKGSITLERITGSNRIKLPPELYANAGKNNDKDKKLISEYLVTASRISLLEERIENYLHNENKDLALVQDGLAKVIELGADFATTLARLLDTAKDPKTIDRYKSERISRNQKLEKIKKDCDLAFSTFNTKITGGEIGGCEYPDLLTMPTKLFSYEKIEEQVLQPMKEWLDIPTNLEKTIADDKYTPAIQYYTGLIDDFQSRAIQKLQNGIDTPTAELTDRLEELFEEFHELNTAKFMKITAPSPDVDISLFWTYMKDTGGGFLAGAGVGAGIGTLIGPIGILLGAGIGSLIGFGLGGIVRKCKSKESKRDRLLEILTKKAQEILSDGYEEEGKKQKSIRELIECSLKEGCENIGNIGRKHIKDKCNAYKEDIEKLIARENETVKERENSIQRLEPKLNNLNEMLKESQRFIRGK